MSGINKSVGVAAYRVGRKPFTVASCERAIAIGEGSVVNVGVIEVWLHSFQYNLAIGGSSSNERMRVDRQMAFIPVRVVRRDSYALVRGYLNDGPDVELRFQEGTSEALIHVTASKPTDRCWIPYRNIDTC